MNETPPGTEDFSAGYALVHDARVFTHDGQAVMDEEMLTRLRRYVGGEVIGMIGGRHYKFIPENSVPATTVAVPKRNHDDPDTLLIQK